MDDVEIRILCALRENQQAGYQFLSDRQVGEKIGIDSRLVAGYAEGLTSRGLVRRTEPTFDLIDNVSTEITSMGLIALDRIGL